MDKNERRGNSWGEYEYVARDPERADGATTADGLDGPPRSWLVSFLLLYLPEGGAHGRELEDRMDGVGFGRTRSGLVYRALRQMEDEGLVTSGQEDGDPRLSQRKYEITDSGRAYLDVWAESLEVYRKEMDVFLRAYDERHLDGGRK